MLSSIERVSCRVFMARGQWFGELPTGLQHALVNAAERRHFDRRQQLYRAGEASRGFWMLLQGQVTFSETMADGARFLFHVAGPGHCFGAAAAASHKPTSVDVIARTRVQALLVPVPELDRILDGSPGFHRAFNELTARRYRTTLRQFAQSRGLPPETYVRTRLSQLAAMWREDGYRESVIELALSQTELANLLGTSRQTVNRYLAKLEQEGLVETGFCSIRVLQPAQLARSALEHAS